MDTTAGTMVKSKDFKEVEEIIKEIEKLPDAQKMQALGYIQGVSASVNNEIGNN